MAVVGSLGGGGNVGSGEDSCDAEFEHPKTLASPLSSGMAHSRSSLTSPWQPGGSSALGAAAYAWRVGQVGTGSKMPQHCPPQWPHPSWLQRSYTVLLLLLLLLLLRELLLLAVLPL